MKQREGTSERLTGHRDMLGTDDPRTKKIVLALLQTLRVVMISEEKVVPTDRTNVRQTSNLESSPNLINFSSFGRFVQLLLGDVDRWFQFALSVKATFITDIITYINTKISELP